VLAVAATVIVILILGVVAIAAVGHAWTTGEP